MTAQTFTQAILLFHTLFTLFWFRCTTQWGEETRRKERKRDKWRQGCLSQSSPCQLSKKAAKPIILSSSFFSGAAEASLDCHMYKGSPYKAIHSTEWNAICGAFLFPLLFSSPPFASLVIKFEQNQMAGGYRESSGGEGGFNESTFCWSETSK